MNYLGICGATGAGTVDVGAGVVGAVVAGAVDTGTEVDGVAGAAGAGMASLPSFLVSPCVVTLLPMPDVTP